MPLGSSVSIKKWFKDLKLKRKEEDKLKRAEVHPGIQYLLGKFGLVFLKLTKVTIHMNSTFNGNTR